MRQISLFGILVFLFCFVLQSSVMAAQLIPVTGVNCGVPYNPENQMSQFQGENSKVRTALYGLNQGTGGVASQTAQFLQFGNSNYACCEPYINANSMKQTMTNNTKVFGETGAVLGPVGYAFTLILGTGGDKLSSLLIDGLFNFPNIFGFSPTGAVMGFPTLGSTLNAYESMDKCQQGAVDAENSNGECYCKIGNESLVALASFCGNISSPGEKSACLDCLGIDSKASTLNFQTNTFPKTGKSPGIWTSIGCIQPNLSDFIQKTVLTLGISLVGLISLLCIIYSSFLLQTSAGDPERIKKAQELLTSCITGLMMVILSVFILRLIGVTILQIPEFIGG